MLILEPESSVSIGAVEDSRVVIIGGENLGNRYMWWNFVSSRPDRIEQAKTDWKRGLIGEVPGDSELAKLPESDSFTNMKR